MSTQRLANSDSAPSRAWSAWLSLIVLLLVGVVLMLTVSPLVRTVPGRDSGVFLYAASVILDGGLSYRDVWDHKPPGIYYLDALGLALGGRTLWGVWAIQTLFVSAAIALGFALTKQALGVAPALFGSAAWMASFGMLLIWDNYPEEYALPLQFASLYVFYKAERLEQTSWRRALIWCLIGMLGAACFMLKPTLVGTQIAIVLLRVSRGLFVERRPLFLLCDLGAVCVGVLLVLGPVTAYLWAVGVLGDGVDAVFRYNFFYSVAPPGDRFLAVLSGIGGVPALSGAPALALIGWVRICRQALHARRHLLAPGPVLPTYGNTCKARPGTSREGHEVLSSLALVALPLDLLLVALSGRDYGYYYTAWLPTIGILCSLFAYSFVGSGARREVWARTCCLCSLLPVMVGVPAAAIIARLSTPVSTAATRAEAVLYIAAHTSPSDSVLIWGAEPGINFAAQRRSPTRFVYQYPLYTSGYVDPVLVREFLRDIEANPPALIIDASSSDRITPPIDLEARNGWAPVLVYDLPSEMHRAFEFIGSHYEAVGFLGPDRWQIYAPRRPEVTSR
jgi:hypothetical protein